MFKIRKEKPSISKLDTMPITNVIGQGMNFEGNISGENIIKIDGNITGNIDVKNGLILSENGVITGDITSENVIVYGKINGNICAKELLLKKSAVVNGNIETTTLEIEMGGKYNGLLKMPEIASPKKLENTKLHTA
ncbi:protein CcmA, bactofilin family [Halpernia humi]|uniref:Protein CcmA, bactofilin family n=1 Tax=Halpernia humi TaxID=493375 RepID=A0A1H5ZNX6_9FLAO|nr:polymer-forming cytoskeletal protein [Halpernia humi]SEG37096.1 protein CcmA, bactofilin family [Halpernia humi]